VQPKGTAEEFGDEPLLIARETGVPVYVAAERFEAGSMAEADLEAAEKAVKTAAEKEAAKAAAAKPEEKPAAPPAPPAEAPPPTENEPAEAAAPEAEEPVPAETEEGEEEKKLPPPALVHLLDDGFQHRQLHRHVDILLLNQKDWRDWLLPAGDLREPVEAIRRASVVALPADEPELEVELNVWGWQGPVWRLHRKMEIPLVQNPVAAFCGIARPEQFFQGIDAAGIKTALRLSFPDHFLYTQDVIEELLTEARQLQVNAFLTTAKDLARLGKLAALFPKSTPLVVAKLNLAIEDQEAVIDWLVDRLSEQPVRPTL
jgi:tetraacyldisaccharide 4'-kinase